MPFKLSESEDSDMVPTFELFANVFGGSAYFFQLFPHHETPVGRKIGAERLLAKKQEGRSKFLKVVDESTGEIAGCGTWIVYENATMLDDHFEAHCFQTNGDFWDTQESKEQAMHAIHEFAEFRKNNAIKLAHGNLLGSFITSVYTASECQNFFSELSNTKIGQPVLTSTHANAETIDKHPISVF